MNLILGSDHEEMPGVLFIAMPSRGMVPVDLLVSYMNLYKPKHYFVTTNAVPLDAARNSLVSDFLVKTPDATHILFWDDDIIPSPDALLRLWRHNEPIVSALYFKKAAPFEPVWGILTMAGNEVGMTPLISWRDGESYYVDGIGLGFCLIRRDVFQKIPYPWFKWGTLSEDYEFCLKAREYGFRIKVDTSAKVKHLADRVPIDESYFKLYQEKLLMRNVRFEADVNREE